MNIVCVEYCHPQYELHEYSETLAITFSEKVTAKYIYQYYAMGCDGHGITFFKI